MISRARARLRRHRIEHVALCRMDVSSSAIGTEVEIGKLDGHQKRIPAKVVRFPFYDPDKTRVRA